jgi:hypothetical protein
VGLAPVLVAAGDRPFRRNVVVEGVPVEVRMESWLVSDTIRRMGPEKVVPGLFWLTLAFSAIVDTVRRELAERYLKDRHRSLAEVSLLLGFAAPSGFSRWYRRQFSGRASDVSMQDSLNNLQAFLAQ